MSRTRWASSVVVWSVAAVLAFAPGCGSNTSEPGGGGDLTDAALPAQDRAVLDQACLDYIDLHATMGASGARAALIADLTSQPGVASVELGQDGYSIWVNYADGRLAGINTVEGFGIEPPAADTGSPRTGSRTALGVPDPLRPVARIRSPERATVQSTSAGLRHAPRKYQALFISAGHEDFGDADIGPGGIFTELRNTLLDTGWENHEIDIRYNRAEDGYATLTFEDFLDLGEYGIVVIFGHGTMKGGHYYVQVAGFDGYLGKAPTERFDLISEMAQSRVLGVAHVDPFKKSHRMYIYLRDDLWRDLVDALPNSFVYLLSCHGLNGFDALYSKGAGNFVGWSNVVVTEAGVGAARMIQYMATESFSDADVYRGGYIPLGSVYEETSPDGSVQRWEANLDIVPKQTNAELYLPAWADCVIGAVPENVTTVSVSVEYADPEVMRPDRSRVEDVPGVVQTIEQLVPGQEATFTAQAHDAAGAVLREFRRTLRLKAGANQIMLGWPYFEDFQSDVREVWSSTATMSLGGDEFCLGPFGNEGVTLTLDGLPWHNRIAVDFDLVVMGHWQGGGCTIEDHPWYSKDDGHFMGNIDIDLGANVFVLDYSQRDEAYTCCRAFSSYEFSNVTALCDVRRDDPPQYGAIRVIDGNTSVYRVHREFARQNGESLILTFRQDERFVDLLDWYGIQVVAPTFGLDNVRVTPCNWSPGKDCGPG